MAHLVWNIMELYYTSFLYVWVSSWRRELIPQSSSYLRDRTLSPRLMKILSSSKILLWRSPPRAKSITSQHLFSCTIFSGWKFKPGISSPPQGSAVFYSYLFMVSVFPNRSSHQKDASTHLPPPQASLIQVRQQVHDSRMEELLVAPTPWCDMATHGFAFVTCGFSMALVSYMFSNLSIS